MNNLEQLKNDHIQYEVEADERVNIIEDQQLKYGEEKIGLNKIMDFCVILPKSEGNDNSCHICLQQEFIHRCKNCDQEINALDCKQYTGFCKMCF